MRRRDIVAAIAAALGEDERAVWLALRQLTKAQLLTEAIAFPPDISAAKTRARSGAVGVGRGSIRHQHRRAACDAIVPIAGTKFAAAPKAAQAERVENLILGWAAAHCQFPTVANIT